MNIWMENWAVPDNVDDTDDESERTHQSLLHEITQRLGENFIIISQFWTLTFVDLFIVSTASKLRSHWFIPFVCQKFNDIFCLDLWPNVCQCLRQYVLFYPRSKWLWSGSSRATTMNNAVDAVRPKRQSEQIKNGLRARARCLCEITNQLSLKYIDDWCPKLEILKGLWHINHSLVGFEFF